MKYEKYNNPNSQLIYPDPKIIPKGILFMEGGRADMLIIGYSNADICSDAVHGPRERERSTSLFIYLYMCT